MRVDYVVQKRNLLLFKKRQWLGYLLYGNKMFHGQTREEVEEKIFQYACQIEPYKPTRVAKDIDCRKDK